MTPKFSKLILLIAFITTFVSGGVFASQVLAADYVIQLPSNDKSVLTLLPGLEKIASVFSSDAVSLSNTYKFQSDATLEDLQRIFTGYYIYLDSVSNFEDKSTKVKKVSPPDDPGFTTDVTNTDRQWGLVKANFPEAWAKTTGNNDVIIAVIDTGIDATHTDLSKTKFTTGYNVLTQKTIRGRNNSDDNGHGTLITGVIAASTNNGKGIAGAASSVSIMPIKALNSSGAGSSTAISEAIVWAADHDADVINLSLGGIGFAHDTVLANAITYAYDKNVVIVAAAGNDVAVTGGNLDKDPVFPICDDNGKNMIIGVTATDFNDLKPGFANFGKACVDVSAPGKRILSTINRDPATGGPSPDSYAYASGTSLAVPFVSAQAGLLRSLFISATNRQIRDRIIGTADNIDPLNLSQCANLPCAGLLGGGRINAGKSLAEQIFQIADNDVVQIRNTDQYYYLNGGKRQLISPFVRAQRFKTVAPKIVSRDDISTFPEGSYAEPLDGTLVKSQNDPTVYYMQSGLRRALTYQVFTMRGFKFSDVVSLTNPEVASWVQGSFYAPPDGTMIKSNTNPTIYWVVNGTLHPVNYKFYIDRGLNLFPVVTATENDISKFPRGDAYIL